MIGSVEERVLKLADALRAHKDPSILTKIITCRKKLGTLFTSEDAYLKVDCTDHFVVSTINRLFGPNDSKYRNYLFNVVVRRLEKEFDQVSPNWQAVDAILSQHPNLLYELLKTECTFEQYELLNGLLDTTDIEKINAEECKGVLQKNHFIYLFRSGLKTTSVIELHKKMIQFQNKS